MILIGLSTFALCGCVAESVAGSLECNTESSQETASELASKPLPVRSGPQIQTSGRVPHVQVGVEPADEVNQELLRLAFTLPNVEKRLTVVSLAGAIGMWLSEGVPVANPKAIVSGREFAHIHTDGSLHVPLPLDRALELQQKGWGERHPWADRRDGWEGLVMLYSADTQAELATVIQLITESYNHVTGLSVQTPRC
ncbi:hypothetical protein AB833_01895 [Chromatiales bacterium (ex Bugula neritina AB1)]|nr:hypothetical protein AB833_01895 [Chromatiales bacterium (ex Bugula neritina AB1)]